MIFTKKIGGLILIALLGGTLAGCNNAVTVVHPDGRVERRIPVEVARLSDGSRAEIVRSGDESFTISDRTVGMYHCTPRCRPTGGGMVGSSGAAPIISSAIGAAGQIAAFGVLGNGGGSGGAASTVSFNNTVSATSSLKSNISNRNNGGNNQGIGNSAVIGSGNSSNLNVNRNTAGANAQNFNANGGGKH